MKITIANATSETMIHQQRIISTISSATYCQMTDDYNALHKKDSPTAKRLYIKCYKMI